MTRSEPTLSRQALPIDAIILAGRRSGEGDPLAGIDGSAHKALLIAGGKPLIRRVVEALNRSGNISRIAILAPDDVRSAISNALAGIDGWRFGDSESSPARSVAAAIEACESGRALLVTTCDHALLNAEMIRSFLADAAKSDAAAACVSRESYEERFPGSRRTFIRLKDFSFSGANLFWFAGARAKGLADFWRRLEAKRKNPGAMALEVGLGPALAYVTGQMTKAGLERTIARKTGVQARLVPLGAPEAAIDVDKPEDLDLVRKILALD